MIKLIVIEPWEFGTLNGVGPFEVTLIEKPKEQFLIVLKNDITFKGKTTKFLLGKRRNKFPEIDLINEKFESVILSMVLIEIEDEKVFNTIDFEDFRGGFLMGEISKS
jgi:hypothetical protein